MRVAHALIRPQLNSGVMRTVVWLSCVYQHIESSGHDALRSRATLVIVFVRSLT